MRKITIDNFYNLPESLKACIGALFIDAEKAVKIFDIIPDSAFDDIAPIYQAIKASTNADGVNKAVLVDTLENELSDSDISKTEIVNMLNDCVASIPSIAMLDENISRALNDYRVKTMNNKASWALFNYSDADVLKSELRKILNKDDIFASGLKGKAGKSLSECISDFEDWLNGADNSLKINGFSKLNSVLGGLQRKGVYVIAGGSGCGKTSFALNLLLKLAISGNKINYYSLEMSNIQLMQRLCSNLLNIDSSRIRDKQLGSDEKQSIKKAFSMIKNQNISVIDRAVGYAEIGADIAKTKPDAVFIDHIGLMKMNDNKPKVNALEEVSNNLKQIALENNTVIIELCQINRNMANDKSKRKPNLSDLKNANSIGEDADGVIFITPKRDDEQSSDEGIFTEIYICKNRHGQSNYTVEMYWKPNINQFTEFLRSV